MKQNYLGVADYSIFLMSLMGTFLFFKVNRKDRELHEDEIIEQITAELLGW